MILEVFNCQKWGEKNNLNRQIFILNSKCVAKEFRKMIKHLIAYLIYSQIWLKLPKDDRHFGYKQKSLKRKEQQRMQSSEAGEKSTWTLSIAPPVLRRRSGTLNVSINGQVYSQATVTSF